MTVLAGTALAHGSLTDLLLENDIKLSKAVSIPEGQVLLLFDMTDDKGVLDRGTLLSTTKIRLNRAGIETHSYQGDFGNAFRRGELAAHELLSPKLILECRIQLKDGYFATCLLSAVKYVAKSATSVAPKKIWTSPEEYIRGESRQETEMRVTQYLQKELDGFVKAVHLGRASHSPEITHVAYSPDWNDPDGAKPALQFGATVGTPAIGNLYLGVTNIGGLPIGASISGMYWTMQSAGLQAEVNYLLSRNGRFKHQIGIAAVGFDEVTTTPTPDSDAATLTTYSYDMKYYVGPTYGVTWHDFRVEVGGGVGITPGCRSTFRGFFQVGYTPSIRF